MSSDSDAHQPSKRKKDYRSNGKRSQPLKANRLLKKDLSDHSDLSDDFSEDDPPIVTKVTNKKDNRNVRQVVDDDSDDSEDELGIKVKHQRQNQAMGKARHKKDSDSDDYSEKNRRNDKRHNQNVIDGKGNSKKKHPSRSHKESYAHDSDSDEMPITKRKSKSRKHETDNDSGEISQIKTKSKKQSSDKSVARLPYPTLYQEIESDDSSGAKYKKKNRSGRSNKTIVDTDDDEDGKMPRSKPQQSGRSNKAVVHRSVKSNKPVFDSDDDEDEKPPSKPIVNDPRRSPSKHHRSVRSNKPVDDSDDDEDEKPQSKPNANDPRRSPRTTKKTVTKEYSSSENSDENNSEVVSEESESVEEDVESDEVICTEDELDSEAEYDEQTCIVTSIAYFNEGNTWDWSEYLSNPDEPTERNEITKDYFPAKGNVKMFHIKALMEKMNWDVRNKKRQAWARRKIELCLKNCRDTVKAWLNRFFVDFSKHCGIMYRDKLTNRSRNCRTTVELMDAMSHFESESQVKNCFSLLYFSFDYMKNYPKIISDLVMQEHSIKLDRQELLLEKTNRRADKAANRKRRRAKLNCVQKLVSITLNEVRKPYRKILKEKYGIEFSLKRSAENITTSNKREIRRPGCLYDWMVSGTYKFPNRKDKNPKLSKQFMIKLLASEDMETQRDIDKAEIMKQKAIAYIGEIQGNIDRARKNIKSEVIDVMSTSEEEATNVKLDKKKKTIPMKSSKEKPHKNHDSESESAVEIVEPRRRKEKPNKNRDSESESMVEIEEPRRPVVPKQTGYKIPRKVKDVEDKIDEPSPIAHTEFATDVEGKKKNSKPTNKEPKHNRQAVKELFSDHEEDEEGDELISKDDDNPNHLTHAEVVLARRKRAREMMLREKQRKDKLREDERSVASEDVKEEPEPKKFKYKRINELEAVVGLATLNFPPRSESQLIRPPKQLPGSHGMRLPKGLEAFEHLTEINRLDNFPMVHPKINANEDESEESLKKRELKQIYDDNIKPYQVHFDKGRRLLEILTDEQHKLFLDTILDRLHLTSARHKTLNQFRKNEVITEELMMILHRFMTEDEGGDLSMLSEEDKRIINRNVSQKLVDIQLSLYENPKSPARAIIAKEAIKEKMCILYNRSPERQMVTAENTLKKQIDGFNRSRELFDSNFERNEIERRNIQRKLKQHNATIPSDVAPPRNEVTPSDMEDKGKVENNVDDHVKDAPESDASHKSSDKSLPEIAKTQRDDAVVHTPQSKSGLKVSNREINSIRIGKEYGSEQLAILNPNDSQRSTRKMYEEANDKRKRNDSCSITIDNNAGKKRKKSKDVFEIEPLKNPIPIQGEDEEELVTILNHRKGQGWKIELEVLDKRLLPHAKPYFAIITSCYQTFPKVTNKYLNHHNFIQQKNSINKWRKIGYKTDPQSKKNYNTHDYDEFTDIPKFLQRIEKHHNK